MKILILGKSGQVGHALQQALKPLGDIFAFDRNGANLEDGPHLLNVLHSYNADVIVNAAAYTAVDKAEEDKTTAYKVNAEAVSLLAKFAHQKNALLVHYSTDYVFDGKKIGSYVETDLTNPQSVYGRSKREGEIAIEQSKCNALVFRTSWAFSAYGSNFVKTVLRLAQSRERLNIVADQFGAPTSAELIAEVTEKAIANYPKHQLKDGLYHLTASGSTSWYELAVYVVERALLNGASLKLRPNHIFPISTEEYPLPAKRPRNSRLDTSLVSKELNIQLPDWRVHVDLIVEELIRSGRLA